MIAVDRDAVRAAAGEFQVQAAVLPAQREEAERRVRVGAVDVADADGADLVDGEDAVHAGVDRLAAFAVGARLRARLRFRARRFPHEAVDAESAAAEFRLVAHVGKRNERVLANGRTSTKALGAAGARLTPGRLGPGA